LIDRSGLLCQQKRVPKRDHCTTGCQSQALCARRHETKIGKGLVQLAGITEHWVVHRHVARPDTGKSSLVGVAGNGGMVVHRGRRRVWVSLQWKDETDGEPAWLEHARKTCMGRE
jgi:hypothetical protein